jgi:uncharacterized membrane-anchored protein
VKLHTALLGLTALILLNGCAATLTPDAQKVILHTQMSTAVSGCKKLGNVVAEAKNSPLDDYIIKQQAINNLREIAYKTHQADTVVLVNVDRMGNAFMLDKYVAQGIAYKCD